MPIEYRNVTHDALGANSFDIEHSVGTAVNENEQETFVNFLQSSTRFIQQITTGYSTLRDGDREGSLAYVENSEGTAWLPYSLGGTYFPKGWYIWDGADWISSKSNVAQALDAASSTGSILQGDNVSLLTNDAGYTTFDGQYTSLLNAPSLFNGDYNSLLNRPEVTDEDLEVFYSELTYTSGDLTKIEYYNNSGKSLKYYTKTLTYSTGFLSQVVLTDNIQSSVVWSKALSYDSNGNLTNLTKL
tara:strand:+ start:82 stop:813 length:732 start_codon:yes stop_codon:yes gene_type:complete